MKRISYGTICKIYALWMAREMKEHEKHGKPMQSIEYRKATEFILKLEGMMEHNYKIKRKVEELV
jgi:hypothetical protein